jgi:nicotinamidase-related amidase
MSHDQDTLDPCLCALNPKDCIVLLVDFQPGMMRGVSSGDRAHVFRAAVAGALSAQIHNAPVVLTTISEKKNGDCFPRIAAVLPAGTKPIERTVPGFDALEDEQVRAALEMHRKAGRTTLIVAGLWTSMCMCFTALHALRDGWNVVGLMDACGDASLDAHTFGLARMQQAGVIPTTWMALGSEWMHDWKSATAQEMTTKVFSMDVGMSWL